MDFLPPEDGKSTTKARLEAISSVLGDSVAWYEFLQTIELIAGGEAQTALMAAQGLALGLRTVASWLHQQR